MVNVYAPLAAGVTGLNVTPVAVLPARSDTVTGRVLPSALPAASRSTIVPVSASTPLARS